MNATCKISKLLIPVLLVGILMACSSNGTRSAGYYNANSYDSYYRRGINDHHRRDYRRPRPVNRPARRRH